MTSLTTLLLVALLLFVNFDCCCYCCCFLFSSADGPVLEKKWYQEDESDDENIKIAPTFSPTHIPGGLTTSSNPSEPAPGRTSHTPEHQPTPHDESAHRKTSGDESACTKPSSDDSACRNEEGAQRKSSDENAQRKLSSGHRKSSHERLRRKSSHEDAHRKSSVDGSSHRKLSQTQSSPVHRTGGGAIRQPGKTSSSGSLVGTNGNLETDGNPMSRHRSDGRVKVNHAKPPAVPPKTRRIRERSKSAGTISKNPQSTTSHRTSQAGSSRRIVSAVVRRDHPQNDQPTGERETSLTSLESYSSERSHSTSHASASRSSLTSHGSSGGSNSGRNAPGGAKITGPVNHDYVTLEPPEHDYAILEPEGHEEFYGACCTVSVVKTPQYRTLPMLCFDRPSCLVLTGHTSLTRHPV